MPVATSKRGSIGQGFDRRAGATHVRRAPEAAEAIGTFALVLCGVGAILTSIQYGAFGGAAVAAAFGLVITVMVYATGHVSGAHFNPAVTFAFAATGHFPWSRVAAYWAAQCLGALAAAIVLAGLFDGADLVAGTTTPAAGLGPAQALTVELVITALLMFVIASVATDGRAVAPMAGIAIGATVALMALWAGPLTGASMNPARSLGPALAAWEVRALVWTAAYTATALGGATLGALGYEAIRRGDRPRGRRKEVPISP